MLSRSRCHASGRPFAVKVRPDSPAIGPSGECSPGSHLGNSKVSGPDLTGITRCVRSIPREAAVASTSTVTAVAAVESRTNPTHRTTGSQPRIPRMASPLDSVALGSLLAREAYQIARRGFAHRETDMSNSRLALRSEHVRISCGEFSGITWSDPR